MNKLKQIQQQYQDMSAIEEVAKVYETIASIEIRKIKNRVLLSRNFFHELWGMYMQLRVDPDKDFDSLSSNPSINKTAVVLISSDSPLGGSIDERLVDETLAATSTAKADYFVIGKHGAKILRARGITPKALFPLPDISKPFHVLDIIEQTKQYKDTIVYFEQFINLDKQQVQVFELISSVTRLSEIEASSGDTALLFASDYLFEPSLKEVVEYLESMMCATALTELILESRLAQLASRFNAMNIASSSAEDKKTILKTQYKRYKRQTEMNNSYRSNSDKAAIL